MSSISGCGSRDDMYASHWRVDPYESKESGDVQSQSSLGCASNWVRALDDAALPDAAENELEQNKYEQYLEKAVERLVKQDGGDPEQIKKEYNQYVEKAVEYFKSQSRKDPEQIRLDLIEFIASVVFNSGCFFSYKGAKYVIACDSKNGVIIDRVIGSINPQFLGSFSDIKFTRSVVSGEEHVLEIAGSPKKRGGDLTEPEKKELAKGHLTRKYTVLKKIHAENAELVGIQAPYSHWIESFWNDSNIGSFGIKELYLCAVIGSKCDMDLNSLMHEWIERAEDGNKEARFVQEHRITELFIAWQLMLGLAYLHSKGCVHSDITLKNILCNRNFYGDPRLIKAVLSDFGGAYFPKEKMPREIIITRNYIDESEEKIIKKLHGKIRKLEVLPKTRENLIKINSCKELLETAGRKADTFALGMVLSVLFRSVYACSLDEQCYRPNLKERVFSPVCIPKELQEIINGMTEGNMERWEIKPSLSLFSQVFDGLLVSNPKIKWSIEKFSPEMLGLKQTLNDYTEQLVIRP